MTELTQNGLEDLPEGIAAPRYDRSEVKAGILHVGLGNFHRAHQAVYLDDALATGGAPDWGILGAGVMEGDARMRDDLIAQDFLYSVTEEDADTTQSRVVGAMTGFLPVEAGHGPIVGALADPDIRIVSLTVTEGGYFVDPATGAFDPDHPAIKRDIASPDAPETVFGAVVAGLRARRAAGETPFTVMSCDNLPHNGAVTRAAVLGIAAAADRDLAAWIEDTVAFPNGMVDRITPATSPERKDSFTARTGLRDARPVFCEPFRQWVLEDKFTAGRPDLEQAGVQFVSDVAPFENMKIRILNGGHAIIAYPAGLLDIEYVHEAMQHPLVSGFLDKVEREDIIPQVPPVPDTSLNDYLALINARFSNPKIADTIRRLCFDGSNRQPKFILTSVTDNISAGGSFDGLALESALWCRYCYGETDSGTTIAANDPDWDRLVRIAREARGTPAAWLGMSDIYGEIGRHDGFRTAFSRWLNMLWADGTASTLEHYLRS